MKGKGIVLFSRKRQSFTHLRSTQYSAGITPFICLELIAFHKVQQKTGLPNKSYLTRVKYYIWGCNAISFCSFSDDVFCLLKPPLGDQPPWRFWNDPAEKVQDNKPAFPQKALLKAPIHIVPGRKISKHATSCRNQCSDNRNQIYKSRLVYGTRPD